MKAIEMLKAGDFNHMSQEKQADGTVIITLSKRGDPKTYKMRVKDLYLPTEQVISEEVIERS